jgi:hypothetical protein
MIGWFGKNKATSGSRRQTETAPHHWRAILGRADGSHLDAVVALNVRLICEFASLVPDRSRSLELQREAVDLALTIQNETYRRFAIRQVEALARKSAAIGGQEWSETNGKTKLMSGESPMRLQGGHIESGRSRLI